MIFINNTDSSIPLTLIKLLNKEGFSNLLIINPNPPLLSEIEYFDSIQIKELEYYLDKYQWEAEMFIYINTLDLDLDWVIKKCSDFQIPLLAINANENSVDKNQNSPFYFKFYKWEGESITNEEKEKLLSLIRLNK
ncbi:hypothetical protein OO013_13770 [Mangrovivirga sp. M17]|uniref:Uncharacterized protein n=1 Tax=Mangrovivirga halotolerans TaxID=2993936 RepID=A0ABT3RTI6_9BACT|nr:hypothetical protein [Mangrovivirga halotolerans]MCX2744945.1 hypothetical protein [Mangrovivirga halotolerans]